MNCELFAIFDAAANMYIEPFPGTTIAYAIRGFEQACRDPKHNFAQFPEDYALYHIGTFDQELGVIEPMAARKVAQASQFHGAQLALEEEA